MEANRGGGESRGNVGGRGRGRGRGRDRIQLLVAAEQEARLIICDSRNTKVSRLKQAKEEADNEVTAYRAEMESQFQRRLSEGTEDSDSNVMKLKRETETQIDQLKTESARVSSDVVDMLLKHVTTVRI